MSSKPTAVKQYVTIEQVNAALDRAVDKVIATRPMVWPEPDLPPARSPRGRPKLPERQRKPNRRPKVVTAIVSEAEHAAVHAIAAKLGVSVSDFVRAAVQRQLNDLAKSPSGRT